MNARWLKITLLCAVTYGVALAARMHQLDAAKLLADSLGPYLNAFVSPLRFRPHAAPYGWALATPYSLSLALAGSLREAVAWTLAWHALISPVAVVLVLRLNPRAWVAALAAGLLVALDGGLLDTTRSGSECYLGPMWLGCAAIGASSGTRWWGAPLAFSGFAMACMNHPFAICAFPLLTTLPLRARSTWFGAGLGLTLLMPRLLRLIENPLPGPGGALGNVSDVVPAYILQGSPGAWVFLAAPLVALAWPGNRGWATRVLVAFGTLFAIGLYAGYLRDHHLRLLSVPLAGCLAMIPNRYAILPLLFLRAPDAQMPPPGAPPPPASLALTEVFSRQVMSRASEGPIVVDRVWLSGPPAAEPAAVILDLHLRGWPRTRFAPGGQVALIVSARREDIAPLGLDRSSWNGQTAHALVIEDWKDIRRRTAAFCGRQLQIGGAWDGIIVMRPQTHSAELDAWWAPCLLEKGSE